MFKALKEFLFGKPVTGSEAAPYKIEPPVQEKLPDTVPVPAPVVEAKVEAVPLNPVKHDWPKSKRTTPKAEEVKLKKVSTRKPKTAEPKEPKKTTTRKTKTAASDKTAS